MQSTCLTPIILTIESCFKLKSEAPLTFKGTSFLLNNYSIKREYKLKVCIVEIM